MTPGDRIAAEFSRDKHHLSDAEQRRLAGMIDGEVARLEAELAFVEGQLRNMERNCFVPRPKATILLRLASSIEATLKDAALSPTPTKEGAR